MFADALRILETIPQNDVNSWTLMIPTNEARASNSTSVNVNGRQSSTDCYPETTTAMPAFSTPLQPNPVRQLLTAPLPAKDKLDNLTTAIFNSAFLVQNEEHSSYLTAAVLMFNRGLSYHLHGMSTGDSKSLCCALHFYSQAYNIVLQESYVLQQTIPSVLLRVRSSTRLVVLLAAALCHNMAAVHSDFWNFAEARLLRCQLAQIIQWEGGQLSQIDTDDFVFFHLGIFFAIIDDFRLAPAA